MAADRKPFHNPFGKLKEMRKAAAASAPAPKAAPPPPSPPRPEPTDADLWAQAVTGARPVEGRDKVVAPGPPGARPPGFWHPDLDALRELEALVSGEAPFDIADSDEYIEGRVSGLDPGLVRKLRRGEFSVQGHLDLHGKSRAEAKAEVDAFLRRSREQGKRCVLLVHGRGLHSKDQVPVLKEALRSWLATARFGRHVLAFATARPQDGGAGAVYVLLRRIGR
ncbi:MAG TPA: Smr/MutS family protein [Anaeromyxobacteraceae bacterium]|nr:Smr/MutS family protein [Anaeromyxobacteraceae bacterium]